MIKLIMSFELVVVEATTMIAGKIAHISDVEFDMV
jgi:hypothetical protein